MEGTNNYTSVPLLTNTQGSDDELLINTSSSSSSLLRDIWKEEKMLWYIAGPAIVTSVLQFSFAFITQTIVGHIGTIELAAFGVQNLVISGIGFGIMVHTYYVPLICLPMFDMSFCNYLIFVQLGMGSALETLCGQAFGAGQLDMLGIYMQRSWVILLTTALPLTLINVFAAPFLKLIGQEPEVAEVAGKFAIWMTPVLYAYALNFPIQKFLQSQSKMTAMALISFGVLLLHVFTSWLFILRLNMGLVGAALSLNSSWWVLVIGQLIYILSGSCKDSWSGFSWLAFSDLIGFVWLSLASAVMLWLVHFFLNHS